MLDKKRVEEAQANVRNYLNEGLLTKRGFEDIVYNILVNNAKESLETANFLAKNNKSSLWIIVSSYYSMFYIANAALCKLGYKVGDKIPHKVTSDALIVYVKDKLKQSLLEDYEEMKEEALLLAKNKAEGLIEDFDRERGKRGFIQYKTKEPAKISKAETSLKRASEFMFEMEKLISSL
ncbi:MAG: HEPN domain-containing protein [Candidatus Pacearchaeota archaeon]|nr:HEPN domain-containing protein [Candidatus Pacearchaeota archaeon]